MNEPEIFIIVLNWNTYLDTKECLESLRNINYSNYKVILVDNGSDDGSGNKLDKEYPECHFIRNEENLGYSEGNNVALRYTQKQGADYALLLNSDVIVDPEFLRELVVVAQSDSTIGIVGPKVFDYTDRNFIQSTGGKINIWFARFKNYGGIDTGKYNQVTERDFIYGTCTLIKRSLLEKIGGLDTEFFFKHEEFDFCLRAKKAGFRIMYTPHAVIWHKGGASIKGLEERPQQLERSTRKSGFLRWKYHWMLFKKHMPAPIFVIPFLIWFIGAVVSAVKILFRGLLRGEIKPVIYAFRRIWYRLKLIFLK